VGNCPLQAEVKTEWPILHDVLLRRWINIPAGAQNVQVSIVVDNDVKAFWNGQAFGLEHHDNCPSREDPFVFLVPDEWLIVGQNLLAIRALDRGSESFIDVKVTATIP
jgi:hypothetical protein